MSVPPVNCAHCGALYMRRDLSPDAPRICNVCENKESARMRTLPTPPNPDTIRIQIEGPRKLLEEVEEMAQTQGVTYSNYFIDLHNMAYATFKQFLKEKATVHVETIVPVDAEDTPRKRGKR